MAGMDSRLRGNDNEAAAGLKKKVFDHVPNWQKADSCAEKRDGDG